MNNNDLWNSSTKKAMIGIISGLIFNDILSPIFSMVPGMGTLFTILTIIAFLLYLVGLNGMKKAVNATVYGMSVNKLYVSALILLCAILIDIIPFLGWLATIGLIVSFIIELIAYSGLRQEKENTKLSGGANLLFFASIVAIIACMLDLTIGWIPVVGTVVSVIINAIEIIMVIIGWLRISKSEIEIVVAG